MGITCFFVRTFSLVILFSSVAPVQASPAKWLEEHSKTCERYYTGKIQAGVRRACTLGGVLVDQYLTRATTVAETGCRLQYGEEPGETYACIIGTNIARELDAKTSGFNRSLQLCSEYYPVRTELDAYLLESCLVGIHSPVTCESISPERSFTGPCKVGSSLRGDQTPSLPAPPAHRALCEKYFDHLRFHMGYRSCLNARAVSANLNQTNNETPSLDDVRKGCDATISDLSNDHERGACLIGAALIETLKKSKTTAPFDACGTNQVRYEDRDFLGCLAASSFLTFANPAMSEKACKETFRDGKSVARSGCLKAVSTLKNTGAISKE